MQIAPEASLTNFRNFYLYGFTNNPFHQSNDGAAFATLYKQVAGPYGGVIIGSSFHPYQLVNPKGTTVWHAAYAQLAVSENSHTAFDAIIHNNAIFMVNPAESFTNMYVWPDTRLTYQQNPVFSRYVPFVIPFLVYKQSNRPNWDVEIDRGMAANGNASAYVNHITSLIRFFMPEPAFITGFEEFEEEAPGKLIDRIVSCKKLLEP